MGGARTTAYLHAIPTRLGTISAIPVPYAIADNEDVPNLLGRRGVFDELQVDFDPTLSETRISGRWLTTDQSRIWEFVCSLEKHVFDRWDSVELPGWSKDVARLFVQRAAQLGAGAAALAKLGRTHSAPLFIRALFDLAAQFEYLMKDPGPRAARYRDFAYVTQYRKQQDFYKNPSGQIISFVASSPDRAHSEPHTTREYNRVKSQFLRSNGRPWDKWYCMTSRDLAKEIGWEDEWRLWYAMSSDWSHGDPFSVQRDRLAPSIGGWGLLFHCFRYHVRILAHLTKDMILTREQSNFMKQCQKDFS